jgi:copper chaperone CopZ
LSGIKEVTGDLSTRTLVVAFDPEQVVPDHIIQAVEAVGYQVEGTFVP